MSLIRLWFLGYINPVRMIDALRAEPAPQLGLLAQLVRSLLDSFLLYLPLSLMGWVPPTPSNITFLPTEGYYSTLIWLTPLVLITVLLVQASLIHVVIRLSGRRSEFDQVVNIVGMSALVVGAFLLVWDWAWIAIGSVDQYFLGLSHLLISLWAVVITVLGLKRILGVPVWLGVVVNCLAVPAALPFAIMFMRSPM